MAKGTILTTRIGGSTLSSIYNENPGGNKNHSNRTFTTDYSFTVGTLKVYYNGQRMSGIDYSENGSNAFEFIYVKPYSVDNIVVDYVLQI